MKYDTIKVEMVRNVWEGGTFMMEKERKKTVQMAISSDLHLLSKKLYDYGEAFANMYYNGDGKQTKNGKRLIKKMFSEIRKQKIHRLLITGDLTLNGEKESHLEMARGLKQLKEDGIDVYVLPGNHDIGRLDAKGFVGKEEYLVPTITDEEFAEIYAPFGYNQAISRDPNSLSYVVKLSDENWLFCLDNCCRIDGIPQRYGEFPEESFEWLEQMLKKTKEQGMYPIVAGHYNLAYHNRVFRYGFTMRNHDKVGQLLRKYDTILYLSGHMHMQHMQFESGIMDIATSSPATYPHQYGILSIEDGKKAFYHTKQIDISENERRNYKNFYAENFMHQVLRELQHKENLTQFESEQMACFAARMNLAYFSGNFYQMEGELGDSYAWELWIRKARDVFFYTYLKSMLHDSMRNHNIYKDSLEEPKYEDYRSY